MMGDRVLPQLIQHVQVDVWGNRKSTKPELMEVANNVLNARLPLFFLRSLVVGYGKKETFDLAHKHVSLQATLGGGAVSNLLIQPFARLLGGAEKDETGDILVSRDVENPKLPAGAFGTHLENLFTQALREPSQKPALPPAKTKNLENVPL